MIEKINILNFKGITKADISLPRVSVLIGMNGSGKSTLLSVFKLTSRLAKGFSIDSSLRDIAPISSELFNVSNKNTNTTIGFIITTSSGNRYKFIYEISLKKIKNESSLVITREDLFKLNGESELVVYKRDYDSIKDSNGDVVRLKVNHDVLFLSNYSDDNAVDVDMSLRMCIFTDDIDDSYGFSIVDEDDLKINTINGIAVSLYKKNLEAFNKAVSAIRDIVPKFEPPTFFDLEKAIKENNEKSKSNSSHTYIVRWNETGLPTRLNSTSLSGGDKKIIYLIFALFSMDRASSIFIEEIENGLHLGRVNRLIDRVRTQSRVQGTQVLFSTHSLDILNQVMPNEVIFCHKNGSSSEYEILSETEKYSSIKNALSEKDFTARDVINSGMFI